MKLKELFEGILHPSKMEALASAVNYRTEKISDNELNFYPRHETRKMSFKLKNGSFFRIKPDGSLIYIAIRDEDEAAKIMLDRIRR